MWMLHIKISWNLCIYNIWREEFEAKERLVQIHYLPSFFYFRGLATTAMQFGSCNLVSLPADGRSLLVKDNVSVSVSGFFFESVLDMVGGWVYYSEGYAVIAAD